MVKVARTNSVVLLHHQITTVLLHHHQITMAHNHHQARLTHLDPLLIITTIVKVLRVAASDVAVGPVVAALVVVEEVSGPLEGLEEDFPLEVLSAADGEAVAALNHSI